MSIELKAMVQQKISVSTVTVHVKVGDRGFYEFKSSDGISLKELQEDCVPDFFPGDHYGDYLILDIDLETGQIKNWNKPNIEDIESIFNRGEE
jgi:hypothetical protein